MFFLCFMSKNENFAGDFKNLKTLITAAVKNT